MDLNKYIRENREGNFVPQITCADGLTLSVQASPFHHSRPRGFSDQYTHVEVGFPNSPVAELIPFSEDRNNLRNTVYPYVPIELVEEIIESYGGLVESPDRL